MVGTNLKPGNRVRFIGYEGELTLGTITEAVPAKGGYMVLPDGHTSPGGFGYSQLDRTCWEQIAEQSLTDSGPES